MLKRLLANALRRRQARSDPGDAVERLRQAAALIERGDLDGANRLGAAVLASDPDQPDASNLMGLVAMRRREFELAAEHFGESLALAPHVADYHNNLGNAFMELWRVDEAVDSFRRAVQLDARHPYAHRNLLYLMNISPGFSREERFREHCKWADRNARPFPSPGRRHRNDRDPARALRVGYVSADFRAHAVGQFIEPVIAGHDPTAITSILYSNHTVEDGATERMRAHAGLWRNIASMDDAEAGNLVLADEVDILVDLAGHTRGNRLQLFALKPAPVQVSFLGYPATTGLSAIDYRLSDALADPPGAERFYRERLYRLPQGLWCYRPAGHAPASQPPPALAAGHVTFGSMNSKVKLNAGVIDAWSRILAAAPRARLLLATVPKGEAERRLREAFTARRIGGDRLEFVDKLAPEEFTGLFSRVDIALDPFPCNGGTTTCESLWMGVPVVSLAGDDFRSRAGLSILTHAGLEEWVAEDVEQYVDTAAAIGRDRRAVASLRAGLGEKLLRSKLADIDGYVRALEAAYRTMWREWCRA